MQPINTTQFTKTNCFTLTKDTTMQNFHLKRKELYQVLKNTLSIKRKRKYIDQISMANLDPINSVQLAVKN